MTAIICENAEVPSLDWVLLGSTATFGDVRLMEDGRYVAGDIEKTAAPGEQFEAYCPARGFMTIEYHSDLWWGGRVPVGLEGPVVGGILEDYIDVFDLQHIRVMEVFKSLDEEEPGSTAACGAGGALLIAAAISAYLLFGWTIIPFMAVLFGCVCLTIFAGLHKFMRTKYVRLISRNGVLDIQATKFEEVLLARLKELAVTPSTRCQYG